MTWVFAILIVLALGCVAFVAAGRGEPLADPTHDRPDVLVPPDRPLGPDDLRRVRFPVVLRGYRMADVDALLARLAAEAEASAAPEHAVPAQDGADSQESADSGSTIAEDGS